jgi:hypothetical protein
VEWKESYHLLSEPITIDGIRVLFLPCELYNFSPNYESILDIQKLDGKYILHFKGERKQFMEDYWNLHLCFQASKISDDQLSYLKSIILAFQSDRETLKIRISELNHDKFVLKTKLKDSRFVLQKSQDKLAILRKKYEAACKELEYFENSFSGHLKRCKLLLFRLFSSSMARLGKMC